MALVFTPDALRVLAEHLHMTQSLDQDVVVQALNSAADQIEMHTTKTESVDSVLATSFGQAGPTFRAPQFDPPTKRKR